jgi:hypothetical protein
MPDSHANFAAGAVATAPSPATTGTTLAVATGSVPWSAPPFNVTVCPAGTAPSNANAEIARVTAIAVNAPTGYDTLTIARGPQAGDPGGINRSIVVGDQIFEGPTAKTFTDIESQLAVPVSTAVAVTAVPGQPVFCTAALAVALPSAPVQGARVQVVAAGGTVTVNAGGSDHIFSYGTGGLTTLTLGNGTNVDLRYLGTVWYVVAGAPQGAAPWLALPSTKQLVFNCGQAILALNGVMGQNLPIAHGLGKAPIGAIVQSINGTSIVQVQQTAGSDATNLYVSSSAAITAGVSWIAFG